MAGKQVSVSMDWKKMTVETMVLTCFEDLKEPCVPNFPNHVFRTFRNEFLDMTTGFPAALIERPQALEDDLTTLNSDLLGWS